MKIKVECETETIPDYRKGQTLKDSVTKIFAIEFDGCDMDIYKQGLAGNDENWALDAIEATISLYKKRKKEADNATNV